MQSMGRQATILVRIMQSKFARNITTLFSGTMLAQLIAIFSYPFLSRLYSPESFGILASVMAIAGIVIPVATLRYESAIVIEQSDKNVLKIQGLCLTALFFTSLLSLLFLFFFSDLFISINEKESVGALIYYAVPIIFLFGMTNVLYSRLNRETRYKLLSSAHIVRKSSIVFFQLIFSFLGIASLGLILGNLLGAMITILVVFIFGKDIFRKSLSWEFFNKQIALRYLNFPKFSAPQSLINAFMAQMPILVFGVYYGAGIVGSLYFATKIVQLPITFIGQSIRTVFLKYASDNRLNLPRLYRRFVEITLVLGLLILAPIILLFLYGPDLFSIVFGDEWRQAGAFSGWLMVWFGANFVQQPSRALFIVFEMQSKLLWIDIFLGIMRLLGLFVSVLYYDALTAIAIYSLISFIFFTFTVIGWFVYLRNRCLYPCSKIK